MTRTSSREGQLLRDTRLLRLSFRPLRKRLAVIASLAVVNAMLEAVLVLAIASAGSMLSDGSRRVDAVLFGYELSFSLRAVCLLIGLLAVVRAGLDLVMVEVKARAEAHYDAVTRSQVAESYLNADWALQSQEQAGGLQATLLNFVSFARTVLTKLTDLLVAAVSFVIMLAASVTVAGWVTAVVVAAMGVIAYLMRPLIVANRRSSVHQRESTRSFSNRINEMVAMTREIRIMGVRRPVEAVILREIKDLKRATYDSSTASYRLQSLHTSITYVAAALGLGALALADVADPQPYVAMVLLLYRAMIYGRGIQSTYQGIVGSLPYLEDLDERLERYRSSLERDGSYDLKSIHSINFNDVSFSYGGECHALSSVSFEIHAGEAIGVVGPSGAGKSTLVQLLLGLRPPTKGELLVDGRPATDYRKASWTRRVSFVPQESALFDQSVLDNVICFRDDISRDQALDALRAAHVLEEMQALADGLDSPVGEGGKRLSGGQRQRVCIARALAGRPDLLILDEPTSALDLASEEAIRQTLESIKGQMTLVIVAHRMSTLRVCDKALVINNGCLEAFDDRATLEADNAYFSSAIKLAKLV